MFLIFNDEVVLKWKNMTFVFHYQNNKIPTIICMAYENIVNRIWTFNLALDNEKTRQTCFLILHKIENSQCEVYYW